MDTVKKVPPGVGGDAGAEGGGWGVRILDAILFATGVALGAALLYYAAIVPNARRAEQLERRGYALEREVADSAGQVARLRREVTALESDPYAIERALKKKRHALRPDLFQ